jgi:hypothetical protein
MRLIDADELIDGLEQDYDDNVFQVDLSFIGIFDYISEQPTAYDVDKVVEKLKQIKTVDFRGSLYSTKKVTSETIRTVDKAIDIVKRGGLDEN